MGIEMSFRDQRVGTSHLDRVKEDVSQEYFTCRNDLRIRRGIANLLDPHGMAGSEIVDAPCVSMSLEKNSVWNSSVGWGSIPFPITN